MSKNSMTDRKGRALAPEKEEEGGGKDKERGRGKAEGK